jgi:hypothetical protein
VKEHARARKQKTTAQSWTVSTMVYAHSHTTLSLPRHTSWINLVEHFSQHMMDSVHSLPQPACRSNSGSLSDTIRTAEDM